MRCFAILALFVISATAAPPKIETDEKRPTTNWDIQSSGIATVSHTGTIFENDNHRLDGSAMVAKDLGHIRDWKPDAYGGRLNYDYKPSDLSLGLKTIHTPIGGTDVAASGTWNFINEKNAQVGLSGQYSRNIGGSGRSDYGMFLGGRVNF